MNEPDFRLLPTDELLAAVVGDVLEIRVLENAMMHKIAELEHRGAAAELGYKNLPQVLRHAVRWDLKTARQWHERARLLSREITPTGTRLDPELPVTADAVAEGALSGEHITAVAEVMKDLPPEAEQPVVEFAREHEPSAVRSFGKELAYRLHQQDAEPREPEPKRPTNQLRLRWTDDQLEVWAKLDKVTGAKFEAMIDPLAKPRPDTADEGPDLRFRAEREGDAFADLIDMMARADQLPEHGGEPARRLACNAGVIPIVLGSRSEQTNIGRKSRTFPAAIRRLLVARDKGCAFPGCTRPPKHCDAHHIRHWADGGDTSVDNAVLLCRHHHTLIHHSGWQVTMVANIPIFTKPTWLDPNRTPQRNLLHAV
ncbi:DUF222 domain-containing protein [Lentzea sp. PSKA42]|uniref:DUF222 domain-containing protein n=1 Tax=Lentzea indica TaxID=2604800 RepID=A0ABX1F9S6_9PSEU|nr:HNH endonuclease signature motif containing protein [Lentzea indica]NKE55641.1 DUF222 domain-containing protein [Lentzea indica]